MTLFDVERIRVFVLGVVEICRVVLDFYFGRIGDFRSSLGIFIVFVVIVVVIVGVIACNRM